MFRKFAVSAITVLTMGGLVAGCGATNNTTTTNTPTTGAATHTDFKVALVTDTGGLNDKGFNYLSSVGLNKAKAEFGVTTSVVQSQSDADYVPNLQHFGQAGYNLVIAVGYLMDGAVKQVAAQYKNTKFLIIDDQIDGMPNVTSAIFNSEQCGYLVGAMAGLMEKQTGIKGMKGKNTVGVVGGQPIPPVDSYIAGFQQGIEKADPGAKVLLKYANSFTDQALGSQIAQSEIANGADIIFQVAGGTGVGVINAAKSAGVYAIGVDADQMYVSPQAVLTSAMKGVDTATYDVIKSSVNNQFKSGVQYFHLSNNGVGLGTMNPIVPKDIIDQVNQYSDQIKSGSITVSATVKK